MNTFEITESELILLEKDKIVEIFKKNHQKNQNKKIYIYGTGINTKNILEKTSEYNIRGLLDGNKSDEYMYGKYIYSIDDILIDDPDIIIVVARTATVKIIVRRISKFCKNNNIQLFDIYGNDLLITKESFSKNHPYFGINEFDLKKEIDEHDIISFDIFDTLLMRKTLFPQDVFDILNNRYDFEYNFKIERISAEQELNIKGSPTLKDIYNLMKFKGLNINNNILKKEIEVEKELIIKRNKMVDIFSYALSKNKRVFLISDMYLNKRILNKFLSDLEITGYEDIYVSCDYNTSKGNGLFSIFKKNVKGNTYLHIGDNDYIEMLQE